MSPSSKVQIAAATALQQPSALELLHQAVAADERGAQAAALRESGSLQGLLVACRGEAVVGSILARVQPGKAGSVWAPQLTPGEEETTRRALVDAAVRFLADREVQIVQALLPEASGPIDRAMRQGGFRRITDLLYLACELARLPPSSTTDALQFEAYSPESHNRLAKIVLQTYQETLDCPELNGVRDIEDTLEGYRATGEFDPQRWLLVRRDGRDVGCLLLADHGDGEHWELVYMGVIPDLRGRGLGVEIVRQATRLAREGGALRLVLAVDAANTPSVKMYDEAGFVTWDRRSVYLLTLPPPSAQSQ